MSRYYDEIRYLRVAIKADEQQLANAPLGLKPKANLKKQIDVQKERLKRLNKKSAKRKKRKVVNNFITTWEGGISPPRFLKVFV